MRKGVFICAHSANSSRASKKKQAKQQASKKKQAKQQASKYQQKKSGLPALHPLHQFVT
jgi:hypothetical protein